MASFLHQSLCEKFAEPYFTIFIDKVSGRYSQQAFIVRYSSESDLTILVQLDKYPVLSQVYGETMNRPNIKQS